jgi:hypothetical protein
MAGIEINPLLISTYARFIISQSTAIAESIALLSLPVEKLKKIASGDEQLRVDGALKEDAIAIALASPAKQIITDSFHAMARVLQTRLEKHQSEEEIFTRDHKDTNPNTIPDKILDKATVVECDSLLGKIDNHCGETFDKYQEILHNCTQEIISQIQESIIQLTDLESHELLFQESIFDLNRRMIDLSITWPKLNYKDFSVTDYTALKCYIAVYSAFARSQKPTDDKTMQKTFKQILKMIKQTKLADQMKTLLKDSQPKYNEWTNAFPVVTIKKN